MSYLNNLVAHWDMSEINPQDISPRSQRLRRGLIAHYRMNDNAANKNAIDCIGGKTGTTNRNTNLITTTGRINSAFDFVPASADNINLPTSIFTSSLTRLSICFWLYADALGHFLFSSAKDGSDDIRISLSATNIIVALDDGGSNFPSVSVAHGFSISTWYHVAITWDGTWLRVYKNAVELGYDKGSFTAFNSVGTRIGMRAISTADYWDGRLDDFRVYNLAIGVDTIEGLYNGGYGTEYYGGSPGTGVGLVQSTDIVPGIGGGQAIELNGSDEYVNIGLNGIPFSSANISFGGFINIASAGQSAAIVFKRIGTSEYSSYAITTSGGTLYGLVSASGTGWGTLLSASEPTAKRWVHVFVCNSPTGAGMYFNGILVATDGSPAASLYPSTNDTTIGTGRVSSSNVYFGGILDSFTFFDSYLSQSQVIDLYNKIRRGVL